MTTIEDTVVRRWLESEEANLPPDPVEDSILGDNTLARANWLARTATELGIDKDEIVAHLRRAGYAR